MPTPELTIPLDKVFAILTKAREYDAKDVASEPKELIEIIRGLNEDEQIDLVALAWLGRGDGGLDEWGELRAEAERAHNDRTAEYLLGMPILCDYLAEALAMFGHSAEEFDEPL
jgi:hypothetical protein